MSVTFLDNTDGEIIEQRFKDVESRIFELEQEDFIPDTPVELDSTLTLDGVAADAKAVGDEINSVVESLQEQYSALEEGVTDEIALLDEKIPNTATVEDNTLKMKHDTNGIVTDLFSVELPDTPYVTPQMFGAVADGETDDTEAVQAALDNGGVIYFPAGVYKVTKQLTTTVPCVIKMFKQYPSGFWRSANTSGRYDYPIKIAEGETDYETEKGWDFGARIECYPSEGEQYGFLIGDGCEVDGLFLRAMNGFTGVLLKYDNLHQYGTDNIGDPITYSSYPSAMRFKHIRLDCDRHNTETTIPLSMFDFYPKNKYFYILDDIVIGQNNEFATYGFRSVIDPTTDRWANSVRISNLCLNILADYPLYIEEGNTNYSFTNWVFEGMSIQTFPYTYNDFETSLEGHKSIVTLKNMNYLLFSGCYIWDLASTSGKIAKYEKLFDCENINNVSCVGCSEEFYYGTRNYLGTDGEDGIETVLAGRLQEVADNASIKNLSMSTTTLEDGSNRISLTDTHKNEIHTDIPPVSLSDEQLAVGISSWMDENALPKEEIGKNKFNVYSSDTIHGSIYGSTGIAYTDESGGYLASHFIPAKYGDKIRLSCNGVICQWTRLYMYDEDYQYLGYLQYDDESVVNYVGIVNYENTAYIRFNLNFRGNAIGGADYEYSNVPDLNLCLTINNTDISYEPYGLELVGGLAQYFMLQSPNGTKYTIKVNDDGTIVGEAITS